MDRDEAERSLTEGRRSRGRTGCSWPPRSITSACWRSMRRRSASPPRQRGTCGTAWASLPVRAAPCTPSQLTRRPEMRHVATVDPGGRMIGLHLYNGLFKVVPMDPVTGQLQEAFNIRHVDSVLTPIPPRTPFLFCRATCSTPSLQDPLRPRAPSAACSSVPPSALHVSDGSRRSESRILTVREQV